MLFGNCCSSDFSVDVTTVWLFGRADDLNTNSTTVWLFGRADNLNTNSTTVWLFGRADDLNTNSTTDWLLAPQNCCTGDAQHRLNNELAIWSLIVLVWTQAQQRPFEHYCTGGCLGRWLQHGLYKGQVVWAGDFNTTGCLETVVHVTSTNSIKDWLFGQVISTQTL